jgi:hypothetical protein
MEFQENVDNEMYYQLLKKYNIEKIFEVLQIHDVLEIESKIKFFDIFSTRHGNYIRINGKIIPDTYEKGELHSDLKRLRSMCVTRLQSGSIFYDICKYIFMKNNLQKCIVSRDDILPQSSILIEEDQNLSEKENTEPLPPQYITKNYIENIKYIIMLFLFVFIMSLRKPYTVV